MISTKTIKLNKPNQLDNLWIEKQLSELSIDFIRWAIVKITNDEIILSVSYHL